MNEPEHKLDEDVAGRLTAAVEAGGSPEAVLPTLDEASTELAAKLGKRHEDRLAMRRRMLEGLTPRGRFRRNALCPCGSGRKFKKCHMRDFKDRMNGRVAQTETPDKETTDDEN